MSALAEHELVDMVRAAVDDLTRNGEPTSVAALLAYVEAVHDSTLAPADVRHALQSVQPALRQRVTDGVAPLKQALVPTQAPAAVSAGVRAAVATSQAAADQLAALKDRYVASVQLSVAIGGASGSHDDDDRLVGVRTRDPALQVTVDASGAGTLVESTDKTVVYGPVALYFRRRSEPRVGSGNE